MNKIIFTPSLFFKNATCPHWIWNDHFSDPSLKEETSAFAEKLLEQGVLHEQNYIKDLEFVSVDEKNPEEAFKHTLDLMKSGVDLIYQGEIQYQAGDILYRGRPDFLEKRLDQPSKFGNYYYAPVDIKSSTDIKKPQWMQLILYSKILEEVQGVFPTETVIINRNAERMSFLIKEKDREKTFAAVAEILDVIKGYKPPLKLSSDCKDSPWYKQCVSDAENASDIALIYNLDSRSHKDLREYGIKTLSDAAEMDVESLPKITQVGKDKLLRAKLQAQSLLDGEIKWLKKPVLPESPLNIYFDIEGDPLLDIQYLWGFWVVGDKEGKYAKIGNVRKYDDKYFIYFLAEQLEDQRQMWADFLKWLEILPTTGISIFHFHNYEMTQCKSMEKYYGGSEALHTFMSNCFDLSAIVQSSIIFPLYFYSIKDIAKSKFLDFKWRHAKAGGAQSIFWYEDWLESGNRDILNDIINYNEDDVRATEFLHRWLLENIVLI